MGVISGEPSRKYRQDRKELVALREAAITQSPHAFVPKEHMTEKEREELYRTRIDETFALTRSSM